ncbi:hypothetical protein BD560DRAFT_380679 [Blakeslea trispora]|nr:hypothetical protein BD560DRAFT_380679 [Blakeslea trispora]
MSPIYKPTKIIYAPHDPFFQEGNIALRAIWLLQQASSEQEIQSISEEATQLTQQASVAICCHTQFPSVIAYEHHYEAVHRNVCSVCQKIFPGSSWLQLHLDEFHDVLLQMKKERGEKIHACYVQDCTKTFSTPRMRRLHLIDKHHYPRYFPFDLVYTGTLTFKQRKAREQKRHEKRRSKEMEVDQLAESMFRLSLPKTISFGHQSVKSLPHIPKKKDTEMKEKPIKKTKDVEMTEAPLKKTYPYPRKRGPKKPRKKE